VACFFWQFCLLPRFPWSGAGRSPSGPSASVSSTGTEWDPVAQQSAGLVPIYGTLVISALAMVIGVLLSLGIAVFVTEVAPRWLRGPIGGAIELLAGIPDIPQLRERITIAGPAGPARGNDRHP
jgi:ABC-type phosphate/phosphonate transport system permease subunit